MSPLSYSRKEDIHSVGAHNIKPVQLTPILGQWKGTNPRGLGISKFIVLQIGSQAYLRACGTGQPDPLDWGEVPISAIYAKDAGSSDPMAFEARYDLGFMDVHLQANFSLGLMVLAGFNVFKDGSGRMNYFSREFFHRES
jgi:hypothetical protein